MLGGPFDGDVTVAPHDGKLFIDRVWGSQLLRYQMWRDDKIKVGRFYFRFCGFGGSNPNKQKPTETHA